MIFDWQKPHLIPDVGHEIWVLVLKRLFNYNFMSGHLTIHGNAVKINT